MTTSPLILQLHTVQLPASHITNLYIAGYHSIALKMKKVLQLTFHHRTSQILHSSQIDSKYTYTICDDPEEDEEEEDFQTVTLDDAHWTTEEMPDRQLCIHKYSVPHLLCPFPCPYVDYTSILYHNTLDLSDISEFEDLMTTFSDEDTPALDDEIGY